MSSENSGAIDDDYILKRDQKASMRLNYLHFWTTNLVNYRLHPQIKLSDEKDIWIADVGTGTGIWLVDLAQHLPPLSSSSGHGPIQLHGFDISSAQFPPAQWLPANVHLHVQDAFAERWPVKWHGKFDVVNIRFMMAMLGRREAFEGLMRNVKLLLKTTGYIQWLDLHLQSVHTIPPPASQSSLPITQRMDNANPSATATANANVSGTSNEKRNDKTSNTPISQSATENLALFFNQPRAPGDFSYLADLGSDRATVDVLLKDLKLHVLVRDIIPIPPTYRPYWNHNNVLALEEIADNTEREEGRVRGGGGGDGGGGDISNGGSGGEKEVKAEEKGEREARTQKKERGDRARQMLPPLKREFEDGWSLGTDFFSLVAVGSEKGEEEGKEKVKERA